MSPAERKLARSKKEIPESSTAPASLDYNDCNGNSSELNNATTASSNLTGLARFFPMSWLRREPERYTPLPESKERLPRAAYGKLNYKYIGNESEGNRFIMNKDL